MSAVAIIPARGGSQRIPRKNIRMFHGKPIIAYSIGTAKASGLFDRIVVCSDDSEIVSIGYDYGAWPMMRPDELCADEVGTQAVMQWVLSERLENYDYACCIYATAPLMTAEDLRQGFDYLLSSGMPYAYVHGWFYWGRVAAFLSDLPLEAGEQLDADADRWIDINTESDWKRAEEMYARIHA